MIHTVNTADTFCMVCGTTNEHCFGLMVKGRVELQLCTRCRGEAYRALRDSLRQPVVSGTCGCNIGDCQEHAKPSEPKAVQVHIIPMDDYQDFPVFDHGDGYGHIFVDGTRIEVRWNTDRLVWYTLNWYDLRGSN